MREIAIPSFVCLSKPISDALEEMAEAGVRLVELHGDAPDRHIDLTDESAVNALAGVVERLPLDVYSVHCAFSEPSEEAWDISQPDTIKRGAALRRRVTVVTSAARLGARHVVVHLGVRERGDERLTRSRNCLEHLVEVGRQAGVRIAVENLPPDYLGGSLAEIAWVLEGLDPEVAGFCLDTGHAMLGDDGPCDYIRALGDRLFAVHWHSNNCRDDMHVCPGVDQVGWDDFFAALDEVNYQSPVTVEAVPPETTPLRTAIREFEAAVQNQRAPKLP